MACIGASSSSVMAEAFGAGTGPFTATWTGVNQDNVTRTCGSFRELSDEEAASRIYGGIHFYFDHSASIGACGALGTYVIENAMHPVFSLLTSPTRP